MIAFRGMQGVTVAALVGMWFVRSQAHPGFHPMLLALAGIALVCSEIGFRAGIQAAEEDEEHNKKA